MEDVDKLIVKAEEEIEKLKTLKAKWERVYRILYSLLHTHFLILQYRFRWVKSMESMACIQQMRRYITK